MMKSPKMRFLLCSFFCLLKFTQCSEIPNQLHVLFRHGEKTPTSTFPNDPHKNHRWETGMGYLTNAGKKQIYSLGTNLKTHYGSFIPKYYWPTEVNFTSSYSERCLMSAELLGAGLFPPQDVQIWNADLLWQPIPIHYLPRNMDNLIAMKSNCTQYDKEFLEVQNSTKVRNYNKEYQELYSYLTEHTGQIINSIGDIDTLYGILEIYQLTNLSLPYWVNDTLMAQLSVIYAQNLAIYSETEYMMKMKGGVFLKTILDLMESSVNQTKIVPKINVYAGHDITIVHVMRALKLIDVFKPEFGSSLIFELHDDSVIKVFYWSTWNEKEPIEQKLPNCKEPCTIENFKNGYDSVLPSNWAQECQLYATYKEN
ncbi:testicular acid phosphatase homolog [Anthonomus grandis grandis]|uniref:testicular acid phosphatase homolog n=1 Tax=Anthonomus grandis grandis TaxID=2921223 RepID=UPI0021664222|nr:testicular acid phosphatase homolog [Anthonomus grandis grandis]